MSLTMNLSAVAEHGPLLLQVPDLTRDEFIHLCEQNPELQIEREANGTVKIMSPTESFTDSRNSEISGQLFVWNVGRGRPGIIFGPSAGFTLPNGAERSPDASWISLARWNALTPEERRGFARICPDFVVELMSPSDRLAPSQAKMTEYIQNGAHLGWLIDRTNRNVYVYCPLRTVEVINDPAEVSAAPELPGFVLQMAEVFEPFT
jgi:Uma2 family endonuclease